MIAIVCFELKLPILSEIIPFYQSAVAAVCKITYVIKSPILPFAANASTLKDQGTRQPRPVAL